MFAYRGLTPVHPQLYVWRRFDKVDLQDGTNPRLAAGYLLALLSKAAYPGGDCLPRAEVAARGYQIFEKRGEEASQVISTGNAAREGDLEKAITRGGEILGGPIAA